MPEATLRPDIGLVFVVISGFSAANATAILILALSPPRRVGHPAYTPTKPPQPLLLFQKQVPGQLFEPTLGLAQQQFSLWPRPCGNRWLLGLRLTNWPD